MSEEPKNKPEEGTKKIPEDLEPKAEEKKDANAQWGCGHYYYGSCTPAHDGPGECIRRTYNTCSAGFD